MEARRVKRNYFYRKRRVGNRVISIYGGSGAMAILAEMEHTIERSKRRRARKVAKAAEDQTVGADKELRECCEDLDRQAEKMAATLGILRWRGEWRQRPGQLKSEKDGN